MMYNSTCGACCVHGVYMYVCTCMHVHVCVYMYVCTCMCVHVCVYYVCVVCINVLVMLIVHHVVCMGYTCTHTYDTCVVHMCDVHIHVWQLAIINNYTLRFRSKEEPQISSW